MTDLSGRVALVTGAARGQGRAHAVALAAAGADVAVTDIVRAVPTVPYELATEDELAETARLVEAEGRRAIAVRADVTRANEIRAVAEHAVAELGRIDVVVANAGIFSGGVPAWELTEEQWDTMLGVNLKGVWLTCKATIPHMLEQRSGSVVLTSSINGFVAHPGIAHYVSAKHGVLGLMRSLANELGPYGIRCNAVCPGGVDNAMVNNPFAYDLFTGGAGGGREAVLETVGHLSVLPVAMVENEDIARAVVWLAGDESRYVAGVALPVDAGLLVKMV